MNTELQENAFRQLTWWQIAIYFGVGLIGVIALNSGVDESLGTLAILLVAVAANHYLPIIVHELYEINDQLAGRSPEFHQNLKREGQDN